MKTFILAVLCSFFSFLSYSQAICGFDGVHESKLRTDPGYAQKIGATNASIRKYINNQQLKSDPRFKMQAVIYTIPVVVHVLHTGGGIGSLYNPTDLQIQGAINYLNAVYGGTYGGMIPQQGGSTVNDIQIQFALAQRTPTCGATNGIDRVDASSIPGYAANGVRAATSTGCTDAELKNFDRWDPASYYNIWVVNKIDGADGTSGQFIAGYAAFAGGSSSADGTVMLATQMAAGEKTLPHEIGHALGLYHTFQGSASAEITPGVPDCPANADPTLDGDLIGDTDPVYNNRNSMGIFDFTCRSGPNPCASPNSYSVNTESNFMAYTNCYKLFTADQKDRMLSAMSIPGRASLVAVGNMSLTPCGTVINFSQSTTARTENTVGTTAGCRTYTDYTYEVGIGAMATADATLTFAYTGTATAGVDYDITTNGNFASPSNILVFPSGTSAPKTFTIRVYDDAAVESAETLIVNFTLNNGGGNATKGTTAPTFTLTISDNDLAPVPAQSLTTTIGTPVYGIDDAPFDARLQNQLSRYLYQASELNAMGITAGTINSLALYVNTKLSSRPFTGFAIRMGQTSMGHLYDNSYNGVGTATTVYTSASYSTIAGWNTFTLPVPFTWDGTSNIVIEICFENGSAAGANAADVLLYYPDGSSSSQANCIYQNGINCSGSFSSFNLFPNGIKPVVRFATTATGTAIENALTSTNTLHVGTGSNDYFYSSPGNKLMARLQNVDATLGCVTASLEGAGTSWQSYAGGQRSAKIFAITPTQNITTTSYTVSLYFNNTELDGKNPALLKMAKTTASSIAGANGSNTILVTPTVTTLGSNVTVFTAAFTGFSRFFLVDNSVSLPIGLLDFTAKLTSNKNALLEWTTSYEKNNLRFEIETSRDGSSFVLLDQVASKGDAEAGHSYNYVHARPMKGLNYYRLKQVDIDGKSSYSRTVSLMVEGVFDAKPFLSPNPATETIKVNFGKIITTAVPIEILSGDLKSVHKEVIGVGTINHSLTINKLPAGVYFIRMIISGKTEVLRFVKE